MQLIPLPKGMQEIKGQVLKFSNLSFYLLAPDSKGPKFRTALKYSDNKKISIQYFKLLLCR